MDGWGDRYLTSEERANLEQQRADLERQRAEAEQQIRLDAVERLHSLNLTSEQISAALSLTIDEVQSIIARL
jgi:predicted transposase YdaD